MKLAKLGIAGAIKSDKGIQDGVNTFKGKITFRGVADSQKKPYTALADLL